MGDFPSAECGVLPLVRSWQTRQTYLREMIKVGHSRQFRIASDRPRRSANFQTGSLVDLARQQSRADHASSLCALNREYSHGHGGETMLVLARKQDEKVVIDGNIEVTVLEVSRSQVRLGIRAPGDVRIIREELLELSDSNDSTLISH